MFIVIMFSTFVTKKVNTTVNISHPKGSDYVQDAKKISNMFTRETLKNQFLDK